MTVVTPAEDEPIAEIASAPASAFAKEDALRIQEELERELEAHEISHRSGGSAGSVAYMEGWRAIEKATHIFGFNGWSSRIIEIKVRWRRCVRCLPASATDAARHMLGCAEGV
jgi:recombination DNA repair RAD52 pathway protein